ncbi:hypothetical protein [Streptomyces sp. NPDC005573]|uniref:hypothetical protein n=1 Tax=unclassified Streptomyces TaxID=2593676 RepID=UPI0033BB0CD6
MGLSFHRNPDGTTTGRNSASGFAVTGADAEEVRRRVYAEAGWEYHDPPPPVRQGHHRFVLVDDVFGGADADDLRYAGLLENPPEGCRPVDRGCFALECERPGSTLLDAVADTVAEIRRVHGLVMNGLGVEKPDEWFGDGRDGRKGEIVAHLLLTAVHRAGLSGYGRRDLVRLLDATGIGG